MARPDRILAQELLGSEVLDLAAGEIIGTVVDYALTREGVVTQIGVLPVQWYKGGLGIAPQLVSTVHHDRICLSDCKDLGAFDVDEAVTFSAIFNDQIQGKTILLADGEHLGVLADFSFSLEDGRIGDVIVLDAADKRLRVPVETFLAVGRDYIVIERAALATEREQAGLTAHELKPVPLLSEISTNGGSRPAATNGHTAAVPELRASGVPPETSVAVAAPAAKPAGMPLDAPPAPPARSPRHISRVEEKAALFGEAIAAAELSKFDQKKRDFLQGRKAHRDLVTQKGETIVARGETLDEEALSRIIDAGMLGDVFIEMTLNK